MSNPYSEDELVEAAAEEVLLDLQWQVVSAWHREKLCTEEARDQRVIHDSDHSQYTELGRANKSETLLFFHLHQALQRLNPNLPASAYLSAMDQIAQLEAAQTLVAINKAKHALLTKGVPVSFTDADGVLQKQTLKVFDFEQPYNNHFIAVRQFEVQNQLYNRRPDIVGFVNGIPLLFIELKAPGVDLQHAYDDNLSDYKDTIPELLSCNGLIVLSNGTQARVGTITSPYKFFLEWKRIEEEDEPAIDQDRMLRGVCEKGRLLDLFENFLLFDGDGERTAKILAKNHQYIGVNRVVDKARNINELQSKLGVFWHTQGSGKSYSMVFICQKILRKFGGSYTFLLVVDRSELENQLYDTFSGCGAVPTKLPKRGVRAKSREHLRELLSENHRYVFTLIHKFSIDPKVEQQYPLITDRKNIIVISDEAHRTQGGVFARNMRYFGIPNANYLGFTGTPLIKEELELTKDIFGDYVSVYDFKRAIEDEATLPLRYQNRGEKLAIANPELDDRMAEILEEETLDADQEAKLRREFARDYPILTSDDRIDKIAKDLVWHFNDRGYQGKAMFVALDKPTAVRIYNRVMHYWPQYLDELEQRLLQVDDEQQQLIMARHLRRVRETEVCVVVSSEQNEVKKFAKLGLEIEPHRRKMSSRDLEKEFKDEGNPFRLAIVCAMWITGFDAPCVSTVYLDKPIKGHTLMQTIARANRVYDDEKENGLIVDYGNVYQKLQEAYSVYGESGGKGGKGGPKGETPAELLEEMESELIAAIETVRAFLAEAGFELNSLVNAESASYRLTSLGKGAEAICLNDNHRAQFEVSARECIKKYKALYPEPQAKNHTPAVNAIEALNRNINKKTMSADISEVMLKLQQEVSLSVTATTDEVRETDYVDLSNLDVDKLRVAFAKSSGKKKLVLELGDAIDAQLQRMCRENPMRVAFYEKYQEIIADYNAGKDMVAVQKAFDDLADMLDKDLCPEVDRAMREGLDDETLAIYDLLKKPKLNKQETAAVKSVATELLGKLKAEKLKVDRWRESIQVRSAVKVTINTELEHLPVEAYPDEEIVERGFKVYQHIYTRYADGANPAL